jgi:hypothetical protein
MKGNQIAGVRNWLQLFWTLAFLALTQTGIPALAGTEDGTSPVGLETAGPHDPNEPPITWVDESHTAITNQAQALTEWMDAFFGDPNYDLEQAESFLRLEFIQQWDEDDGSDFNLRLRGKVQLPQISKRLNLIFQDDEGEELTEEERQQEDQIGLQYNMREGERSRFDITLGWASDGPRPGVRYRYENSFNANTSYRYLQRLQHESGEGFYTIGRFDINHRLAENKILRWFNRGIWGEETDGVEWRTGLSLRQRKKQDTRRPVAIAYFTSINGVTRPNSRVKNYRAGVLWRRKIYRDYLFFEVEPAMNYRQRKPEDDREPAWSVVLRLEIALERDLRRVKD